MECPPRAGHRRWVECLDVRDDASRICGYRVHSMSAPLAAGASAPRSVVNRRGSRCGEIFRFAIASAVPVFAPMSALVKNDDRHAQAPLRRLDMPSGCIVVGAWCPQVAVPLARVPLRARPGIGADRKARRRRTHSRVSRRDTRSMLSCGPDGRHECPSHGAPGRPVSSRRVRRIP